MRKIWIISLFPKEVEHSLSFGVIGNHLSSGKITLEYLNPADFNERGFKGVDGHPYGGGPGMVMRADVMANCINDGVSPNYQHRDDFLVIYPNPKGKVYQNEEAKYLSRILENKDIVFVCGRYEGIDERFIKKYVDLEYSIGDFVLSGGELACSVIIDSLLRFSEDVLGNKHSALEDSFEEGLLDSPKYTKPRIFEGMEVPEVLLSGNHAKISAYNEEKRLEETHRFRPDLINKGSKSE